MKINVLTLFLFPLISFGQLDGDLQPENIYKNNNVESREQSYTNSPSVAGIIFVFDAEGRLREEYLKSNYNRDQFKYKKSYIYSDAGQLIQVIDSSYEENEIVVSICNNTYENNVLKNCTCSEQNNKISSTKIYETNGKKVIETLFRGDSAYRTQTTEYDSIGYKIRFYGYSKGTNTVSKFYINGHMFTVKDDDKNWDYIFVNGYSNGVLIKQTRYESGIKKETESFQYNKNGLLVRIINTANGSSGSQEIFKYKFVKK